MATKTRKKKAAPAEEMRWPFGPKNYLLFAIALVVIVVGYILLSQGDITLAPILLVLGYCVLIPIAILVKGRPEVEAPQPAAEEPALESSED
jgi:hypothetical protein